LFGGKTGFGLLKAFYSARRSCWKFGGLGLFGKEIAVKAAGNYEILLPL
jgi:hypothetical protein